MSRPSRRSRVAVLSFLALAACKTTNPLDFHTPAPPPPAGNTVLIDLAFFRGKVAQPGSAFATALAMVASMDSTVQPHLELAAATLDDAAAKAVTKPNDFWEWPFDVSRKGVRYTGKLLGGRQGLSNAFRLAISSANASPPFSNFTLLNGRFDYVTTQGQWFVYDLKSTSTAPAWIVTSGRTATRNELSAVHESTQFDYTQEQGIHRLIRNVTSNTSRFDLIWTPSTGTGSIAMNGADKRCWDAALIDVVC